MLPNDFRSYMHHNKFTPQEIQTFIDAAMNTANPEMALRRTAVKETHSTHQQVLIWVSWNTHKVGEQR